VFSVLWWGEVVARFVDICGIVDVKQSNELPLSLDCTFFMTPSVFSNVYFRKLRWFGFDRPEYA
jgi:hypothetical protein